MTVESKEKKWDAKTERRKGKRQRRRLVDLTLKPGTDRRNTKEDRRRKSADEAADHRATERLSEMP